MECSIGPMDASMMESGSTASSMESEFTPLHLERANKASGPKERESPGCDLTLNNLII